MVSVVMITYGHEEYIQKAVEAVLDQECNFDFELILSNDASPDKTDVVVKKILATHPRANRIRYTLHEKNIGMMANSIYALNSAKGKYVALCEGDDYWTDKSKLKLQVDFLENNPDYVMCFHKVLVTLIDSKDSYIYPAPASDILYFKDILRSHYIATCTLMFRNHILKNGYPDWLIKSISGDIPIEILLSSHGKTKYLDREMACYRRNAGGISQSPEQIRKMRSGYIYMYALLLWELGIFKGYYLISKLVRLIGVGVRNWIFNKLNLGQLR